MTATILLVDDHPLFRKGLRLLLEAHEDIHIVGEAGDGQEALGLVRKLSPDVVIMDIAMPDFNGIDAARQIVAEDPSARVVALSMHAGRRYVEDMLQAGAVGYILKKCVPEELVNAIRTVIQGDIYLSPEITGLVVGDYRRMLAKPKSTTSHKADPSIQYTKLIRPSLIPGLVPRSDLVAQLDALLSRPLTLVSAPAGYGKSTMASLWLEAWDGPHAWLTLDDEENDHFKFVTHLLAAVGNTFPRSCGNVRAALQTPAPPPVPDLIRLLVNDLSQIEKRFILVLEDFHHIRNPKVHDLLERLLRYPPPNMHLMLLTRRDPPFLTSALRGRGKVSEIGITDLRFTTGETRAFIEGSLGKSIDEKTAAAVQVKLEGWPAGIRLIEHPLKRAADPDAFLNTMKGGFAEILDYLVTEVLTYQTPEMAKLMTATAIPDKFCAPLCDVLSEIETEQGPFEMNGDEFITRLQKDNLFLVAIDPEKRWFRYHILFRQLLMNQVDRYWRPEEIDLLQSHAKAWFAANTISSDSAANDQTALGDDEHAVAPHAARPPAGSGHPGPDATSSSQALVEPLTHREYDVLKLLSQRFSNQEIAEALFISPTTVKTHLQNIYQKLDVHQRHKAVAKARNLGIL